jgi:hypothetical protein
MPLPSTLIHLDLLAAISPTGPSVFLNLYPLSAARDSSCNMLFLIHNSAECHLTSFRRVRVLISLATPLATPAPSTKSSLWKLNGRSSRKRIYLITRETPQRHLNMDLYFFAFFSGSLRTLMKELQEFIYL